MLCLLILFLPELALSQTFGSVELTLSATAVFQEPVTLTCTVQGENLSDFTPQISWFIKSNSNEDTEQLHTEIISITNSTSYQYVLDSDGQSGEYHCSVNETISNNISIHFRSLTMKQIPEVASVYKNQQVEIQIIQEGDVGVPQIMCQDAATAMAIGNTIFAVRGDFVEAKVKFKPEKTVVVTCEASFGVQGQHVFMDINSTIEVLVPEWSVWSEFSESCEIRPEKMYQCAKMRTRTCINYSEFSSCEGEQNGFLDCNPDDCEPTVTNWGVWGETCQYNSNMTACQKSRERFCTVAVNSCSQALQDFTDCPDDQCDKWSDWEQWSHCAQPVDDRLSCKKERERQCLLVFKLCVGENMEVSDCDRQHCAPKFKSHGRKVIRISYRLSFFLNCDVEPSRTVGYQGMEVMWKRDAAYILSDLTRADFDTLRYQGDKLTEHETGNYTCCVRNECGTRCRDNWDVKLSNHGPVRSEGRAVDDLLRFTVERGKNITLHCYLEGNKLEYMWIRGDGEIINLEGNKLEYMWIRGDGEIIKGETLQSLQITGMTKDKQGKYSCCAFDSEFGNSLCSQGYEISEPENTQRKYLIITITVESLLILGLILYITCSMKKRPNILLGRAQPVIPPNLYSVVYQN